MLITRHPSRVLGKLAARRPLLATAAWNPPPLHWWSWNCGELESAVLSRILLRRMTPPPLSVLLNRLLAFFFFLFSGGSVKNEKSHISSFQKKESAGLIIDKRGVFIPRNFQGVICSKNAYQWILSPSFPPPRPSYAALLLLSC